MEHLDLFSGIGGFSIAADQVWEDVSHTFVEVDPFCQEVLKKHWPNSKIHGDIRTLVANTGSEESSGIPSGKRKKVSTPRQVYLLTGGFPCQPFSQAGRRKGTADDRYLWPEMFRVIREFKPTWVIAENVRGLVTWNEGMVLEQVCADLESEGYEVQPLVIPAVAVNAPHRRDRVWIIANNGRKRWSTRSDYGIRPESKVSEWTYGSIGSWEWNWKEVATTTCDVRMDDGIPKRMDRASRLKALGNAIVPQVATQIMKTMK